MPCTIHVRGLLEPVTVEDGFTDVLQALNMSAAQGKEFVVTRTDEGGQFVGFALHNILFIKEQE